MTAGPEAQALADASPTAQVAPGRTTEFPRSWRFLPLETYPALVGIVQRPLGKVWLLLVFAGLLSWLSPLWLPASLGAMACAMAGRYRLWALTATTLAVLVLQPGWFNWSAPEIAAAREGIRAGVDLQRLKWVMLAVVLSLSVAAIYFVRRFPRSALARWPVLISVTTTIVLLLFAASGLVSGLHLVVLWAFLATLIGHLWFLSYALTDQQIRAATPPAAHLGAFHPFWGSSTVPLGKGIAYLRKYEASGVREIAVVQLKGLKLLAWACLLTALWEPIRVLAVDVWRVPSLQAALERQVAGHPYPWSLCWAATLYAFFDSMLSLTVWSHACVATARLAGFGLLRNTYRPLSSTTLAQFFNRYYYYYKELLVDFFFFPTFLRFSRRFLRLRLLLATFMAAGVGNWLFHFLRDSHHVASLGLADALRGYQPFAFYCAVLGVSLGISQLRPRRRTPRGWLRGQLLPSLWVLLFYCLLQVFMSPYSPHALQQHFVFVGRLMGVGTWM